MEAKSHRMATKLRTIRDAEKAMFALGHDPDPPEAAGISGYPRLTCRTCNRAALVGPTHVYGSALENPCRCATEGPQE